VLGKPQGVVPLPVQPPNYGSYDWVDPDRTPVDGTSYKTYHSKTVRADVSYLVYLSPDYEAQTAKRYPVLYDLPAARRQRAEPRSCGA